MAKLYRDGATSDATVASGARLTPAARAVQLATGEASRKLAEHNARKLADAMKWLAERKNVTPVGTGVAQATVEAAGVAAGHQLADVQTAIAAALAVSGRFVRGSGTDIIRRF